MNIIRDYSEIEVKYKDTTDIDDLIFNNFNMQIVSSTNDEQVQKHLKSF